MSSPMLLWIVDRLYGLLYTLAKLVGDYNAVNKGKVGKRVGRRVAGEGHAEAVQVTDRLGHSYLAQVCNLADMR